MDSQALLDEDPVSPLQDAGIIVLSMGDGMLIHLPFRSPDPTIAR
jgi:hypothetical protein